MDPARRIRKLERENKALRDLVTHLAPMFSFYPRPHVLSFEAPGHPRMPEAWLTDHEIVALRRMGIKPAPIVATPFVLREPKQTFGAYRAFDPLPTTAPPGLPPRTRTLTR